MFHEILVLFGYLAGVAPGLELVTGVVITGQRQTALLAKQAAEIDVLTGGRFRLGLGIGWNPVEYEALGMNFHDRGRRLEEQIDLMRRLWTEPVIDYDGRWHKVTAAGLNPLPVQRPIPIWIGGSAERALRRTALLADGFFPQRPLEGGWPATMEQMRAWVEEAGRDWESFGVEQRINVATGTPDDWRQAMDEWRELGATHISLVTTGADLKGTKRPHRAAAGGEGGADVIVPDDIERYAAEHTTPHDALLAELAEETRATLECPQMLTGPIEGRLLGFLVWSLRARERARDRNVQRLLGDLDGGGPCRGRPHRYARAQRAARGGGASLHRARRVRRSNHRPRRAGGRDARAARRPVGLRLHRRRQGGLHRLLRGRRPEALRPRG